MPLDVYTIDAFAKQAQVSVSCLRKWDAQNRFKPAMKSQGGHRYYTHEQVAQVSELRALNDISAVAYCDFDHYTDDVRAMLKQYFDDNNLEWHFVYEGESGSTMMFRNIMRALCREHLRKIIVPSIDCVGGYDIYNTLKYFATIFDYELIVLS